MPWPPGWHHAALLASRIFALLFSVVAFSDDTISLVLSGNSSREGKPMKCRHMWLIAGQEEQARKRPARLSAALFVTSIRCCHCGQRFLRFGLLPGRGIPDADDQRLPNPHVDRLLCNRWQEFHSRGNFF